MKDYIYYIVAALIFISIVTILILKKRKTSGGNSLVESNKLLDALGTFENIVNYEQNVSRINVYVKNTSLVDVEAINSLGVDGVFLSNDKVQIILRKNAAVFLEYLDGVKKV